MTENYTLSDIAAVSGNGRENGAFGGDWTAWIILFLIFGMFGWGGFGGWGNGYGGANGAANNYVLASDFATIQRQLSDGFNAQERRTDAIVNGICDLGYTQQTLANNTNMAMMQGFNAQQAQLADCCCKTQQNIKDTQYTIATTGAGITAAIKDCCCENEKTAMQNRFDMAQYNCGTLQAIDKLGDRIIDYMAQNEAQKLRDENAALRLAASQAAQNTYLVNTLHPQPVPAFNVPAPWQGYGCNGGCGGC